MVLTVTDKSGNYENISIMDEVRDFGDLIDEFMGDEARNLFYEILDGYTEDVDGAVGLAVYYMDDAKDYLETYLKADVNMKDMNMDDVKKDIVDAYGVLTKCEDELNHYYSKWY